MKNHLNKTMKNLHVYDRPMCCSSGVCGGEVDRDLICFALSLQWLRMNGIETARYNPLHEYDRFAENSVVKEHVNKHGADCLPLILLDGRIVSSGRYPSRIELSEMTGIGQNEHKGAAAISNT